jgi:hypothetical protein
MARRLLSGWLIALAALARSLALMFERAAADRSEPAPDPDPVMVELAARYPGAPAHWLAHVAEGMARTAEAGEVPLSLTSDAMAWPQPRPTVQAESQEGAASEPDAGSQPVSGPPQRPSSPHFTPPPPARRAVEAVPSLAALQSRSSEVWRRPAVTSRRLSRPVFAPPVDPVPPSAVSEDVAPPPPRRPQRPTVAIRAPFQARPGMSGPSAKAAETTTHKTVPSAAAARLVSADPPSARSGAETPPERADAPPKARVAPPIRSVATPPPIVTVFEPPVGWAPRSAIHREAPAAIDAAHVRRSTPSLTRRVRRVIFRALAALQTKPRPDRHQTSTRPRPQLVSETSAGEGARRPTNPPLRAVFPTVAEPAAASRRRAPAFRPALEVSPPVASRRPRLVWSQASSRVEIPRQASPPSIDDRWPAFPPKTFSPPPVAELPAPRLEQLAREQEEGRWSV